jgi:hypothetical protein
MNDQVVNLVKEWKRNGSIPQESFDWSLSRKNWAKTFPKYSSLINELPDLINRSIVRKYCQDRDLEVVAKFLVIMVWGYGDRGYGPYRVMKMLGDSDSIQTLIQVQDSCNQGKPVEAYDFLKKNRILQLGPSYGTKVLNFLTPRDIGAPIYDSYIAKWITTFAQEEFTSFPLKYSVWNTRTYSKYRDWVIEHSANLDCFPDDIELNVFRAAADNFSKISHWKTK